MSNETPETHAQLSQRVGAVLGQFSAEIMRHSMQDMLQLLRRADLSMPRLATLMFISRRGCASVSDISEHLNLALGTTSQIVDQLVAAEYVSRHENPDDRRLKQIRLTERGAALVQEAYQARVADLTRRMQGLPEPLLHRMLDVLTEATSILSTTSRRAEDDTAPRPEET